MSQQQVIIGTIHCQVERLGETQPKLRASDWRSPLVYRLTSNVAYQDSDATIDLSMEEDNPEQWVLRLSWEGLEQDFVLCLNSYQESVLTEFAALGVSCIAVRHVLDKTIIRVTRRGEKADYWLENKENLLEVSGQSEGDLENLRDQKKKQLLENPFDKPGYVSVTNFSERRSYLCYYEKEDTKV